MRVLELFAGCGGASLGLKRAGFQPVACVERDEAAVATLASAGMPALLADVNDVDLAPFAGVELLWASPPCQPGSTAGKRRGAADPRDGWPATLRALDVVRPTWFLAENVVGWTFHGEACGMDGSGCAGCAWDGSIVPAIRARFAFHGELRLNAADFGVPQHRRRVFLWGGPLPIVAPTPTHGTSERPWRSVRDSLGDVWLDPATCESRACYPCDGSHGRACTEVWRLDSPAPTVMTTESKGTRAHATEWTFNGGPDRVSDTAFLIAGVRRIEVAEGLALQGLPADWPLQGTKEEQYRQVGNAVPPDLAKVVATAVAVRERARRELVAKGVDLPSLAMAIHRAVAA
jgi:DNA (cytosine-5)-methyltransferase 1